MLPGKGGLEMNIAILGAGGIGSYYGGTLARAGNDVGLLARGEHRAALAARGLEVRTPEGSFTVPVRAAGEARELQGAELAIVAVKGYSLPEVAPAARELAEGGAIVLPLLNGVEAADRLIAAGVPEGQVLGGLTQISAVRLGPGVVERRSPFQRVVVGERQGGLSGRAEAIAAAFRATGAEAHASEDIEADLWRKLVFIATMAVACGLARTPIGAVRAAPLGPLLLERSVGEAVAVARALGVALGPGEEEGVLATLESLPEGMKPSFLLDLEAGGPNELDDLCGAISRLGRSAGVGTPVHDVATAAFGAAGGARVEMP
jgi:2-dehydropantoate 2-reductase